MFGLTVGGPGNSSPPKTFLADLITLGRHSSTDLILPYPQVSKHRAAIFRVEKGSYAIRDLSSRNGTWVNGHAGPRHLLSPGEKILLGTTTLTATLDREALLRCILDRVVETLPVERAFLAVQEEPGGELCFLAVHAAPGLSSEPIRVSRSIIDLVRREQSGCGRENLKGGDEAPYSASSGGMPGQKDPGRVGAGHLTGDPLQKIA